MHHSPATPPGQSFFPPGSPAGYTLLEEYLHFLAVPHGMIPQDTPVTIDLRKFTSGFTKSPEFTTTDAAGGTVSASGPGNHLVTFTPSAGHTGRAGFQFTVTDADRSTWTQQCALLVHAR